MSSGRRTSAATPSATHSFARRNFRLAGRLFDLFVEAGAQAPPRAAVASLNELARARQPVPADERG